MSLEVGVPGGEVPGGREAWGGGTRRGAVGISRYVMSEVRATHRTAEWLCSCLGPEGMDTGALALASLPLPADPCAPRAGTSPAHHRGCSQRCCCSVAALVSMVVTSGPSVQIRGLTFGDTCGSGEGAGSPEKLPGEGSKDTLMGLDSTISRCGLPWFPAGSAGKESACNAADPGSIPGLGRSPGEGLGCPLQYSWASLLAQMVKNPPAMQETLVGFLGRKDPLEKG